MPALLEDARRDEAIATVVAGAAENSDATAGRDHLRSFIGHGTASVFHQRERGDARLDGQQVRAGHFIGGQKFKRLHR